MEASAMQPPNVQKILCCECGVPIEPNTVNMCVQCVRSKIDITEGILRTSSLYWCKFCDRYLQPPDAWITAPLDSKELLSVCLKRIKAALHKVRVTDAAFIWTEPHSKRLKVRLTVQREIIGGAVLQQQLVVEYIVHNQMCDQCRRAEAKDFWRACVQIRQHCDHRKTMFYLEQILLKAGLHLNTTDIRPAQNGIDLFYSKKQQARKLVDYLMSKLPCRYQYSKELVTHDAKNNIYDYKHTFCVEIVPICKDDLVCLPKKLAASLGNINQLCLVLSVTNVIHLIDPRTGQISDVSATVFWRTPFTSVSTIKQAVEYSIIDSCFVNEAPSVAYGAKLSNKHMLADVECQRSSELGRFGAQQFSIRTHLGHLINPGDLVSAYDLKNANVNNIIFDQLLEKDPNTPDVVIVRKLYDRQMRKRQRKWQLRRLGDENAMETASMQRDFDDFCDDLEEDHAIRQYVNIYKRENVDSVGQDGEEDYPQISIAEMIDKLDISDQEMASDSEEDDDDDDHNVMH